MEHRDRLTEDGRMPFAMPAGRLRRFSQLLTDERRVLDALLDSVNVAVVACDVAGNVTHANRRTRELMDGAGPLGLAPESWIAQLRPRTPGGAPLSVDQLPILRALRGETVRELDVHVDSQQGEMILSTNANPVEDSKGKRIGAIVAFEDVTERRARESRMRSELRDSALAAEIEIALQSGRASLFAQPVLDLQTGETVLEELLLRIRSADGTIAGPCAFLAAAERYDTITSLDMWVLEHAARVAAPGRPVTINVSARTVGRPFFLEAVEYVLERDGLEPHLLTFEITETAVVSDLIQATRFAERLHEIGCNFALDDFGTGYAALIYLKILPIQYLKIDSDFVRDLTENARSRAVVSGIVALASGFGQRTIAEGVEDQPTLEALRRLGVDMAQGYYIGRPAPVDRPIPPPGAAPGPAA
jgi:EAL domain-containing protein (putative c-di-GMP-specific phosphodiesterase class I)